MCIRDSLIENTTFENFLNKKQEYKNKNPFFPNWETVIISKIYKSKIEVYDHSKVKLIINLNSPDNIWLSNEDFNKGDVIYIERKKNSYTIKQEPLVNGAIIVMDPYNGDILAPVSKIASDSLNPKPTKISTTSSLKTYSADSSLFFDRDSEIISISLPLSVAIIF